MPAPRQEDYFGGVLRFVRVWVGPHSAWKLKTVLPPTWGTQKSINGVDRLNYTAQISFCLARRFFYFLQKFSIDQRGQFVKIVNLFLGDCCFENDFLKIL